MDQTPTQTTQPNYIFYFIIHSTITSYNHPFFIHREIFRFLYYTIYHIIHTNPDIGYITIYRLLYTLYIINIYPTFTHNIILNKKYFSFYLNYYKYFLFYSSYLLYIFFYFYSSSKSSILLSDSFHIPTAS